MSIYIRKPKVKDMDTHLSRLLSRTLNAEENFALVPLWRSWEDVVGPLAGMVVPLGHKGSTLIVGVEDSAVQQEMHYYGPMIMENANAFLEKKYFDKVRVELLMGKTPLSSVSGKRAPIPRNTFSRPEGLGELKERIPSDSPVGRSYRAYLRMFDRREKTGK